MFRFAIAYPQKTPQRGRINVRKTVLAAILISALLISAITIISHDLSASAQTKYVTINTDGSVTPSTAPIQRIGDSYLVTNNTGSIFIKRSNITLDGQGHRIQGEIHLPIGSTQFTQVNEVGGIYISNTKNVTITNFSIENCKFGVSMDNCSNITIYGLNVTGTWNDMPFSMVAAGIVMWQSSHNNISGNRLDYNEWGVYLGEHSEHNTFVDNTIIGSHVGITFFDSSSNVFYHNNINNTLNFYDSGLDHYNYPSTNSWDSGKEGNYWSDYNGTDQNNDGIGDTPYKANAQNIDKYPLIEPFNSTYYWLKITPPKISLLFPSNTVYNESSVSLVFNADKAVNWTGFSLDGKENVTFTGNVSLSKLSNGLHNVTVYATDTFGNMGVSETVSFIVDAPDSFPVVPIAVVSAVVVGVAASAGFLIYFKKRKHQPRTGHFHFQTTGQNIN
jgi:parallel beta-helix repeat protein